MMCASSYQPERRGDDDRRRYNNYDSGVYNRGSGRRERQGGEDHHHDGYSSSSSRRLNSNVYEGSSAGRGRGRRGSRSNGSRSPTPPAQRSQPAAGAEAPNGKARKGRTDLSPSRERSRARERHRRKLQADCIRRAGGYRKLADSEGKEPVRLFWDGFQWVAKTGASSALLSDPILVNMTRKLRRLYFGNLPLHLGLTETNFQHIVFQEMKKRGYCNNPSENPVLCVWFAKDKGNYGFVEFASVEETERALTMDGMDCLGVAIKVSRPNDYCSATQAPTVLPVIAQQSAQLLANALPTLAAGPLAAAIVAGGLPPSAAAPSNSQLVLIRRMVIAEDVEGPAEYEEILDDVREECGKYGAIVGALIISPPVAERNPELDMGDVYLFFETCQEADACLSAMQHRKYFDRAINAAKIPSSFWDTELAHLGANKRWGKREESLSGDPRIEKEPGAEQAPQEPRGDQEPRLEELGAAEKAPLKEEEAV